jgi:uncharacterized repeat protein (TIGR03806 family)
VSARLLLVCIPLFVLSACHPKPTGVEAHLDDHYPELLSEWKLFIGTPRELKPNQGVIPYDVNSPLFSNYASKFRTIWMPAGQSGAYDGQKVFNLPVGTILSKTFSFGDRHIETRLYIHKANGWAGVTYVWNHAQSDAVLDVTPEPVPVKWNGMAFDYDIPNVNQCKVCHEGPEDNGPLGVTARNLNREYNYSTGAENQLVHWTKAGYLRSAPAPAQAPRFKDDLDSKARAYLDVNCGSCHVVGGRGMKSGVFLTASETNLKNLGVCKATTDTPHSFDIIPGKPDRSALLDRMLSTNRKIMMPDLGHSVVHKEGVDLIRQWIAAMPGSCS